MGVCVQVPGRKILPSAPNTPRVALSRNAASIPITGEEEIKYIFIKCHSTDEMRAIHQRLARAAVRRANVSRLFGRPDGFQWARRCRREQSSSSRKFGCAALIGEGHMTSTEMEDHNLYDLGIVASAPSGPGWSNF